MKSLPILYIVVPCYNEEEALPLSAPVFRKKLGDLIDAGAIAPESRIVLVDDGSKDATWSIIRSLHESDAHFTGLRQICNRGHQNALTARPVRHHHQHRRRPAGRHRRDGQNGGEV